MQWTKTNYHYKETPARQDFNNGEKWEREENKNEVLPIARPPRVASSISNVTASVHPLISFSVTT